MLNSNDIVSIVDDILLREARELEATIKYGDKSDYTYWSQALRAMVKKNYQVAYNMLVEVNKDYIEQINSLALKDDTVLQKWMYRVFKQDVLAPLRTSVEFATAVPEIEKGLFEIYFTSSIAGSAEFKKKLGLATTFSPANQYSIDYYKYLTDSRSKYLLDTNKRALANTLKSSATKGLTLKETKALIIKNLKDTTKIAARAHAIATTETTISLNWAKYNAGAGTKVKMLKTWYTTGNNQVRTSHEVLDSITIPYEEFFITGNGNPAAYPGDVNLPANDIIDCLCTFGQAPA